LSIVCSKCGTPLANGWVGPCPKCGYREVIISDFGRAYDTVVAKIVQPSAVPGSFSAATTAISTISGAYYDAKIRLESLRIMGVPEEHLKPLELDINKLNEDKTKAEDQIKNMHRWSSEDREKFAEDIIERLDKHASAIRKDIKLVGIKLNGTTDLIKRLSERAVTKDDLKTVESLLTQNQEILIDALDHHMDYLKETLAQQIEEKVGKEKASRFWETLEKISTLGGTAQFAEYVKKLIDFLNENKILQTILPVILKLIFR
jgi:hypothetical protein